MPRWLWSALLLSILLLVFVGHQHGAPLQAKALSGGGPVTCAMPPGLDDAAQPRQSPVNGAMPAFRLGDALVTPLAGFSLQARVLSRENYSIGTESRYSPTDLALGWGPMAQPAVGDALDIEQGSRWYHYHWGNAGPPIAPSDIVSHSANMHMVPGNAAAAEALARIAQGQIVRIDGWLIGIESDQGWHWRSSLSRDDSGAGACELVLVCAIKAN